MNDSALNLLGICRKAGKISLGHDACKNSLKNKTAKLCVICSDASDRLKEEISNMARQNDVEICSVNYTMFDIRQALSFKAAVFTVDDEGFAKSLIKKLETGGNIL